MHLFGMTMAAITSGTADGVHATLASLASLASDRSLLRCLNEGNPWPQDSIVASLCFSLSKLLFLDFLVADEAVMCTADLLLLSHTLQSFLFHFHRAVVPFPRPSKSSQRGVPSEL